jgi:flagellar biosynthetic protein FliO
MGAGAPVAELPSLGGSIAVSFVSLGLVCLLAWGALRWLARRGVGQGSGPVKVLARCPLEPRRSVYLIEAAGRCFLVGVGDGPMALLAEVDRSAVASAPAAAPGGFAAVLARALGRSAPPAASGEGG